MAERTKIIHDKAAGFSVQRARGFVSQQDARIVDHCAGNGHTLLLAARKTVAAVVHTRGKAHKFKGADNPLPAFFWRNFLKYQGKFNIFKHSRVVKKVARLHDKAHGATAETGSLLTVKRQHILAKNLQRAGIRRVQHAQHVQHGGFAAARRPHDGHHLAGNNFNIHATQHR